jgi:hypothetical protein
MRRPQYRAFYRVPVEKSRNGSVVKLTPSERRMESATLHSFNGNNGSAPVWDVIWRDEFIDGKHVRKQQRVRLAAATVPEREIQKIVSEYLRPLNPGSGKSWVGDQLRALHRNDLQTSREASDGDNQF